MTEPAPYKPSAYEAKIIALAASFPALARRPETYSPWDALEFAEAWCAGSGGEIECALFVLSVWDPMTDWARDSSLSRGGRFGGRFDLHRALQCWGVQSREAQVVLEWARAPWWP